MADPTESRSSPDMIARLSVMMLLQLWCLGLWYVTFPTFVSANTGVRGDAIFSAGFIGYSAAAGALGSLFAPALFGWIADRFMSAERLMALLHVVAALAVGAMHEATSQLTFFVAMVVYFQVFAPSTALASTIAFSNLRDSDREFPAVRLYGTVGWIMAGILVGVVWPWASGASIEATRVPMTIAIVSHLAMAAYALTLPRTEAPTASASGPLAPGAGRLLRNRPLLLFLLVSMFAAAPAKSYDFMNLFLNERGYLGAAATLTLGQISEVTFLAMLPWLTTRFRLKTLFRMGVLAWILRYALLTAASSGGPDSAASALVIAAILLHGAAFGMVYIGGQMYVDRLVDPSRRGAAQGLHAVATGGFGHMAGAAMTGWAQSRFLTPDGVEPPPYNWQAFWIVPVVVGVAVAIMFALLFSETPRPDEKPDTGTATLPPG